MAKRRPGQAIGNQEEKCLLNEANYFTGFSDTYPSGASIVNGQVLVARGNGTFDQQNIFNQSEVNGSFAWLAKHRGA